ncbi:MAG: HEAT repeat domain-containing protein [Planctomycetes bacterium]|nr:HEAT repeat domain-containing protein [Planctomycetota bacterium]
MDLRSLLHSGIAAIAMAACLSMALPARADAPAALFLPQNGDRIVLLGDGLIEREQRAGYLETMITAAWPDRNITFRNLGFSGDTPRGESRVGFGSDENTGGWRPPQQRDPNFGFTKLMQQVRDAKPTWVFVGYGSAAAFEDAQVASFAKEFDHLLDELTKLKVRLVLLTPTPQERLNPSQPDPAPRNARLAKVAEIIRAAAAARQCPVVDSFAALTAQARQKDAPLTDSGIHLSDSGYNRMAIALKKDLAAGGADGWEVEASVTAAQLIASSQRFEHAQGAKTEFGLWLEGTAASLSLQGDATGGLLRVRDLKPGKYALTIDGQRIGMLPAEELARGYRIQAGPDYDQAEALRAAIIEKNRLYFQHFRPQNEAYIFLFRRHERGDHASEIAQLVRRVEEKDQEIARLRVPRPHRYELIREKEYPAHWVPKEAAKPDTAAELKAFTVADEFEINLFAADPLVAKPININFDERGRMFVATSTIYPHLSPGQKPDDKILVLEDTDQDGRADRSTVFADGLLIPHSVIPGDGGVYVTQSTEVLFLKDTDGDGRADVRRTLLSGFGNADVHHMIHTTRWGVDGNLYFNQSIYINSSIETPWGVRRLQGSGIWSLHPQSLRLETVCRGMVNPWGHAQDRFGQSFATDGAAGGGIFHVFPGAAFLTSNSVRQLIPLNPGHVKACGLEVLSGRHIPPDWRDTLMTTDFLSNRVVRYRLSENGSGYASQPMPQVLKSSNLSFRPVDIKMGPDGAIYVVDWYNPVIDHGEVDFHHPLRDHKHGRIWRLTAKGRPLVTPPALADASVEQVLASLKLPEAWSRDQARRLLRERSAAAVLPALKTWLAALDPADSEREHHRLEALWVCQGLRAMDTDLLRRLLKSPDHHARAAAVRVLGSSHDWLVSGATPQMTEADTLGLLATAISDGHSQVRLEAITALRQMGTLPAANLAMAVLNKPLDTNLDYAAWLAAREMQSAWLPALHAGQSVFGGNARQLSFALAAIGSQDAMQPLVELVASGKLAPAERLTALATIAELGRSDQKQLAVAEVLKLAGSDAAATERLLSALVRGADRKNAPPPNAEELVSLLESDNIPVTVLVAQLSGRWKLKSASNGLCLLAAHADTDPRLRSEAARAMALLGDPLSLKRLTGIAGPGRADGVRRAAVIALAGADPAAAALHAVELLSAMKTTDDPAPLLDAFLGRREGPLQLAKALKGQKLSAAVAGACIRLAESSGRPLEPLLTELRTAGGVEEANDAELMGDKPAEAVRAALLADFEKQGDAARGEMLFRRSELSCLRCHAIGGAGGHVGPDLAGLGGSAQPGYLLESLLEPSAKIKDGFQTVSVVRDDGTIVSGIAGPKAAGVLPLRDAQGALLTIPLTGIEEMSPSTVSLMPQGLVRSLRRQEMLDLLKFLSALGRDPQFTLSSRPVVRHWEAMEIKRPLPASTAAQDTAALERAGGAWTPRVSTVAGFLPLSELPVIHESPRLSILRFHIEATVAGEVELHSLELKGVQLLSNGKLRPLSDRCVVPIVAGRQAIDLVIDQSARSEPLQLELWEKSQPATAVRLTP